jgi:transcriptional regulator with XRE-family HTH domain
MDATFHAAMLGRPVIKCKPASCQLEIVYATPVPTKRAIRPSYGDWAAMQLRTLRELEGVSQEEYAVLLSARLGATVPYTRSWMGLQESGKAPVDAAVLLAAYVQSGLDQEEIARHVIAALLRIPGGEMLDIAGEWWGRPDAQPPRIRDLVQELQQADGDDETPREKSGRPPAGVG